MSSSSVRLTGSEQILSPGLDLQNATIFDFWQWSSSDLMSNSLRGIFAEWLIAKIIGIDLAGKKRDSWGGWDLETPEGVKIEVKTSAYIQAWDQAALSKIVFSGLRAQTWAPATGYSGTASYNADLYIFCLHTGTDRSTWNALDLDKWRFYLLRKEALVQRGTRALALGTLRTLANELTAPELHKSALTTIEDIYSRNNDQSAYHSPSTP